MSVDTSFDYPNMDVCFSRSHNYQGIYKPDTFQQKSSQSWFGAAAEWTFNTVTGKASTVFTDETVTLMANANRCAQKVLETSSLAVLGKCLRKADLFRSLLDVSLNVNLNSSSSRPAPTDEREAKKRKEEDTRERLSAVCIAVGIAILKVGFSSLLHFNHVSQKSRNARAALSKQEFYGPVTDDNEFCARRIAYHHTRILTRQEKDAKIASVETLYWLGTGTIMATGGFFGSMLAMQASGVCAAVLAGRLIYSLATTSDNERANQVEAEYIRSYVQEMQTNSAAMVAQIKAGQIPTRPIARLRAAQAAEQRQARQQPHDARAELLRDKLGDSQPRPLPTPSAPPLSSAPPPAYNPNWGAVNADNWETAPPPPYEAPPPYSERIIKRL